MSKQTILVTGGTGYIGSWVVKGLIEKGHNVRLASRNIKQANKFAVMQSIAKKNNTELSLHEADLNAPGSFHAAAQGCDTVIHMASPFTLRSKNPQQDIIKPALEGTRNVLSAADASETVKRVILTSSAAAVYGDNIDMKERNIDQFTEAHFNHSSSPEHQPYSYSKVAAENEAWNIHKQQQQWKLIVLNPAFVLGPSISQNSDSESLHFFNQLISGEFYPAAPDLKLGVVDVRDVAQAHIQALDIEQTDGRYILCNETLSVKEMAQEIEKIQPNSFKLPKFTAPKFLLYLVAKKYGLTSKFIKRNIGHDLQLSNSKSRMELGVKYRPIDVTLRDMLKVQKQKTPS